MNGRARSDRAKTIALSSEDLIFLKGFKFSLKTSLIKHSLVLMVRIFLVRTQWLGMEGPGQELSKRLREEEVDKLNMNTPHPQSPVSQNPPLQI